MSAVCVGGALDISSSEFLGGGAGGAFLTKFSLSAASFSFSVVRTWSCNLAIQGCKKGKKILKIEKIIFA